MKKETIRDYIADFVENHNESAKINDGFEEAFVGMVERYGQLPQACYDYEKCVDVLAERFEVPRIEAKSVFQKEMVNKWFGLNAPYYIYKA